jgi:hypothetical protein
LGESKTLAVEAKDSDENLVVLSPESYFVQKVSGAGNVNISALDLTGSAFGALNLTAQANGITSLPTPINVTGGPPTGEGRIVFLSSGQVVKSMSGDGSDLRTAYDGTSIFSAISNPSLNFDSTKLVFYGSTPSGFESIFVGNSDGTAVADLFIHSPRPNTPFKPAWNLSPASASVLSGQNGIWYIKFDPDLGQFVSEFYRPLPGYYALGSIAAEIVAQDWPETQRPLLAIVTETDTGSVVYIDGTVLAPEVLDLHQIAISKPVGNSFFVVARDSFGFLRKYPCLINSSGSDTFVTVGTGVVITSSGGYSFPTISPSGAQIGAQKGELSAATVVTMNADGSGETTIASGFQPSWR